jgi:hypothetical protein
MQMLVNHLPLGHMGGFMKSKLGFAASAMALGGTYMLPTACTTMPDFGTYAANADASRRFCDNLNEDRGGFVGSGGVAASAENGGKQTLEYNVVRDMDAVDDLVLVFERAEACRRWYSNIAGITTALDAGGAGVTSAGGVGLLAFGGAAATTTNAYLAAFTLAPTAIREVMRQEPQGVLAYQASEATTLAECQMLRVRAGLINLVDNRFALESAIESARKQREALTGKVEEFANKLLEDRAALKSAVADDSAEPEAPLPFGQLVAQDSELKELVQLARHYDDLIASATDLLSQIDQRTGFSQSEIDPATGRFSLLSSKAAADAAYKSIHQRLAIDLNTKIDAINLIWSNNFRQLAPKPEQSLRSVLAAPFSVTAKLIAGEEAKAGNPEEVARATYDFSASYGSHGVQAFSIPTIVVKIDKAVLPPKTWAYVDTSLDNMRTLSSAMSVSNSLLTDVADVDAQSASGYCRLTPSGIQNKAPDPAPPSQAPLGQPILVMTRN